MYISPISLGVDGTCNFEDSSPYFHIGELRLWRFFLYYWFGRSFTCFSSSSKFLSCRFRWSFLWRRRWLPSRKAMQGSQPKYLQEGLNLLQEEMLGVLWKSSKEFCLA